MNEEKTTITIHSLYQQLATFRRLKTSDLLFPGRQTAYEHALEESHAALVYLEGELARLGDEIEYHHLRIVTATQEVHGLF